MQSAPRRATPADAAVVATLLDAFNREFDTPTPGPDVLAGRLRELLAGAAVLALLVDAPVADPPAAAFALLTLRPSVWYPGPVAVLDELYVVPALRGRGLGTALLHAAEAEVRSVGGELMEVNVDGEDTDARRFYARHGYTCVEPGLTEPSLYYWRELPS